MASWKATCENGIQEELCKGSQKKARDRKLAIHVKEIIQSVEDADNLYDISNLKKLKAEGDYCRIRLGEYRIGLKVEDNTVVFVRFLNRSEIYRYFP